jgi:beta-lactamase regulating signal transducer with metallopeptidase domain
MSELFLSVLNMSLTASYVILFVIVIRLLLKKAPKFISYALWGVVAFRLIIPFSFESMFSLMPRNTNVVSIPHNIIYQQGPQINSGIEVVDSFVSESLPAPTVGASVNPLQLYTEIGAYIWILGIMVLLIYSVVSVLQLKRQLKSAQLIEQNIFEAKNLKTPFVLGLIRPKIYLPTGLNVEERSYILLHEQTHIHRKDHIIKILAFLILSIHWFNPLVWIAFMLMSTDMELSCDERVLKEMNEDIKKPYANSLLSLAAGRHILNGSPLAFGEGNVKRRIKNVLHYKRPNFWVVIASATLLIVAGISLLSNPQPRYSNLTLENVESMTLVSGLDDTKHLVIADKAEWVDIIDLINTAKRSKIAEEYRHTYGELYSIYNTLTVSVKEQGEAKTYSLMIYHHKDWDVFHGEYEYKLALNYISENGKSELWGLPYAECYQLMEWINGIYGKQNEASDMNSNTVGIAKLVEDNLSIIMSSPKHSSNPQDYINAHKNEYENFMKYGGEDALQYMLAQFEAGNAEGLRGQIMMLLCKELLGARNNVTDESLSPREWYDALTIRQEIILPHFEYDGQDPIEKLVYDTKIERNSASNKRGGFIIVAPKVFGSYVEEDMLKVFVTTYSARYKLYGNTLSEEGGSIIPSAITYRKDNSGGYILEKYEQARDGSEFGPSIRKYCTMPVSEKEIKGLADKILKHYGDYEDIRVLLHVNLYKHLKKNGITDATFTNSHGKIEFSTSDPQYKP